MLKRNIPGHPDFFVFQSGTFPKLLISSGVHGDEFETIEILEEVLAEYQTRLPPFVFVPQVSPTAVLSRTRTNADGLDLNRQFTEGSEVPEVVRFDEVIAGHQFELFVSFHEDLDPEVNAFYIYDLSHEISEDFMLKEFGQRLASDGYRVLSGYDDPNDPALGYHFTGGYRKFVVDFEEENGNIEDYVLYRGKTKKSWTVEIPGLESNEVKRQVIERFVREVLVKTFTAGKE